MEPNKDYTNLTIVKELPTSHLTTPFPSFISLPIQTVNSNGREVDRDIEAITYCTFFELIQQRESASFLLALIKDSSGAFAAFDALALKEWVVKRPINPLSQAAITHTSLYKIDSLLGPCELLGSSDSIQAILSDVKNKSQPNDSIKEVNEAKPEEGQSEEIVKDLNTSHLTKPFASKIKFSIQRYNPATKKQETVIEAITNRSFIELIKKRESMCLSFVLALVEDHQGEFSTYDASELNASVNEVSVASPLKKEIKRISWYKIDRLADDFTFLGDSAANNARFIDCFIRANTGDSQAQYELGCLYEEGTQVAVDSNRGMDFFRLGAKSGHVQAFLKTIPMLLKERKHSEIIDFFKTIKVESVREIEITYVDLFYNEFLPLHNLRYDLINAIRRDKRTYKVTYLRGKCLQNGWGTTKSLKRALAFFEEASGACPKACYELAIEACASKDFAKAKEYLHKAGESHSPSQLRLAELYLSSGENNPSAAVKILNRLCERNIEEAFLLLAKICMNKSGTHYNPKRAQELLKRASKLSARVCYRMATFLRESDEDEFWFDPQLGFQFIEKAIKMDPTHPKHHWLRFTYYRDGLVPKSEIGARDSLMRGAELGDLKSARSLGYAFYYGQHGLSKDLSQAIHFFQIAKSNQARLLLAKICGESKEPAEQKKAVEIYQSFNRTENPLVVYQLHMIYLEGRMGQEKNYKKATFYLSELKFLDYIAYYLQRGIQPAAYLDFGNLPQESHSLDKAIDLVRSLKKNGIEVIEIGDVPRKVSALGPKKDIQTERLSYLISAFAFIPFLFSKEKESENPENLSISNNELKTIFFNEYKSIIAKEFGNVAEQGSVEFVFQLTQLFHEIYNLNRSIVDLKNLPFDVNPILSLYRLCADSHHPEAQLLLQDESLGLRPKS